MALMQMRRSRVFALVIAAGAIVLAVVLVVEPMLGGRSGRTRGDGEDSSGRTTSAEVKLVELQHRVQAVLQATLRANPQLAERQRQLGDMVREKMKARGYDPEVFEERLQSLRSQLADKKLDEKKRDRLVGQLRTAISEAQGAEQQALQDPKIKRLADDFQRDLLAAMSKQDPSTPSLLQQLQKAQQELQRGG